MKQCIKCGAQINDDAAFCPLCGAGQAADAENTAPHTDAAPQSDAAQAEAPQTDTRQTAYQQATYQQPAYQQPVNNDYDHTADYDPADISDNKVICMCIYLLGMVGIIIAMLASGSSPYVAFNVRQGLKLTVVNTLLSLCALVLFFTILVPMAAGVCACIVFVVRIICFVNICEGKAIEAPIVRSFGFLR